MHRTILVGSPRTEGRSAALADEIFNACIEDCPEDGISLVSVSSVDVAPCVGCEACKAAINESSELYAAPPEKDDPLRQNSLVYQSDASLHQCFLQDGMKDVRLHLDAADHVIVVCPLYFASAPAQFKAVLDRLQPYFWSNIRSRTERRRTFEIHVVGEGGTENPYGFDSLVGTLRSALGVCGFQLQTIFDWTGLIAEDGEIIADAVEYDCTLTKHGDVDTLYGVEQ